MCGYVMTTLAVKLKLSIESNEKGTKKNKVFIMELKLPGKIAIFLIIHCRVKESELGQTTALSTNHNIVG